MNLEIRLQEEIEQLGIAMSAEPQVDIKVAHHFSKGIYAREITIPKGVAFVGKVHKHQNLNIISRGKIIVSTFEGSGILEAPYTVVSPPGVQRAGFALEETVWTTIHGTYETNLDTLEKTFVTDTQEQYLAFMQQCLKE